MWSWQGVLALLAVAWALQCVGTLIQVRRYRAAFRELSSGWSDGWMGVGRGGSRLQAGAIVMAVVAPDETVRRAVAIRGRTVFARAVRLTELEDRPVSAVRRDAAASPRDPTAKALLGALDQVALVRSGGLSPVARPEGEPVPA